MISIVIPAYNEVEDILLTTQVVQSVLKNEGMKNAEIIVIDDGSTDGTYEILKQTQVTVLRHIENLGYGKSLKDGIAIAKNDVIVIIDADLTYPFDRLKCLLEEFDKGYDMVVGSRSGEHYEESTLKTFLRKILKIVVEFAADKKIPDINSGFRVFRKSVAIQFFNQLCDTFSFTTSLTLNYMMTQKTVFYVSIPYYKRRTQTKVRLVKDSLRTMRYILQAMRYYNPHKLFRLLALICFGLFVTFFSLLSFFN